MIRLLTFILSFTLLSCSFPNGSTTCSNNSSDSIISLDTAAVETPQSRHLSIMMMGDIMPGTQHPQKYLTPDDGKTLFENITPLLQKGDFVVGNLEGTLVDDSPTTQKAVNSFSQYVFMIPTRYTQLFKDAGFTALAVINNHANDVTSLGIESTRKALKNANIPYSGFKADGGYTIIEKEGIKYALCAFGTSPNGNHIDNIAEATKIVTEADSIADIVIVSFHGGCEGTSARHVPKIREYFSNGLSRGDVYKFSRACVDASADIVFGHSPHLCRAMEIYNGRPIAYSLGNFCTPYCMNIKGIMGYAPVLEVIVDDKGNFIKGKIHSFKQRQGKGPVPDSTNAVVKEIRTLSNEDFPQTSPFINDNGEFTIK
ncbi:MAG: CapA family protein [Muribaculaceae bacterium]|nr:CapA family protein [Muribaculaceae bacterium]